MDRLALLCTLHADGPKTLRRLREAGCPDLGQLAGLGAERVARVLGLTPAAARRFLREAELLGTRLDGPLEREEVLYPPSAEPAPAAASEAREVERVPRAAAALPRRSGLDLRDRALLDKVIDRWRHEEVPGDDAPAEELAAPAPPPEPRVASLRPGELAGLDAAACAALAACGVATLAELRARPVDELAAQSGLGFTRVRTLQFLAARALGAAPTTRDELRPQLAPAGAAPRRDVASAVEERLSLAGPAAGFALTERFGEDDEGAGGPFA